MKIVYCTDNICYMGGVPNITITKANGFVELGHDVWIIVTDNKLDPVFKVNPLVKVIDLNINYYEDDWKSLYHYLKSIVLKRRKHRIALEKVLNDLEPDVVISTGLSEKYFLANLKIKSNPIFIREMHLHRNYRIDMARTIITRFIARCINWYDYSFCIKKYDKIIVLTNEDKAANWSNDEKVCVIPNSNTICSDRISNLQNQKMITAGRLVYAKNYKSLINVWSLVKEKYPDWKLEIWGDGDMKNELKQQIENLDLTNEVILAGYTDNIMSKMLEASGFILTSLIEGFGLVLVEAMSCGLPVISYACKCGPKDIIEHGTNGFLCPLNDEKKLAEYICTIIEDKDLRVNMGEKSKKISEKYKFEVISRKWLELFDIELLKKRHKTTV